MVPRLYIVIPCYNEEKVLPVTSELFINKIKELISRESIDRKSKVLFVNDGSSDNTWNIISNLSKKSEFVEGISLARNSGHQNALLAGLFVAETMCDITISIDCDGQDDIDAMDEMVSEYRKGSDIVYGIRSDRKTDTVFKKVSAEMYYKLLAKLGVDVIFNHADYRLMSCEVIRQLMKYEEVNMYLRGIIPTLGYNSSEVYYSRKERMAGETHYPLSKMLALALDGITSFTIRPLRLIIAMGIIVAFFSFVGVIWSVASAMTGETVDGWASMTCIVCFLGGIQLISMGVVGEYVGKIYMESKHRPKYNVIKKTWEIK